MSNYKKCLTSILGLLGMHIDHSLVTYTLEHLSTLHSMLAKYPMLQKECTKVLVALAFSSTVPWSKAESISCLGHFLQALRQASTGCPKTGIPGIFKGMPLGDSAHPADAEPRHEQSRGALCHPSTGVACILIKVAEGAGFPGPDRPEASQFVDHPGLAVMEMGCACEVLCKASDW